MKIYDISQELLSSAVYDGDPKPSSRLIKSISDGEFYNLTEISMCVHNGTHIDAPCHFISGGADITQIPLERLVGFTFVVECTGDIDDRLASELLTRARRINPDAARRILIKGDATVTEAAARTLADGGVYLVGTESQSVGDANSPMAVHLILLNAKVALLEGLRLSDVAEGVYFLAAQPISIKNSDGAPVRAILIEGIC